MKVGKLSISFSSLTTLSMEITISWNLHNMTLKHHGKICFVFGLLFQILQYIVENSFYHI